MGYGLGHYGYRGYGYGYPYSYGHYGYYGKRSADAEPTAEAAAAPTAEADPWYGYYGHGYGLGYRGLWRIPWLLRSGLPWLLGQEVRRQHTSGLIPKHRHPVFSISDHNFSASSHQFW